MARIISLLGPEYKSETYSQSQQSLVNFYLEQSTNNEGPGVVALPFPGCSKFIDISTYGRARVGGSVVVGDLAFVVHGNSLLSIDSLGSVEHIGYLNTYSGPVCMAAIESEILIVDGVNGYSYKITDDTFVVITDEDFPYTCKSVTGTNDYFIVEDPHTQMFYVSELADGRSWSSLDFAASDVNYDTLLRVFSENNRLWLIGTNTSEIWQNTGNPLGAPFDRVSSGAIKCGTAAIHTVQSVDNSVIMLARNEYGLMGVVSVSINGIDEVLSTLPMLQEISSYPTYSDAYAVVISHKGHLWYLLTFPSADKTWCFDIITRSWSRITSQGTIGSHYRASYTYYLGKNTYLGDSYGSAVLVIENDKFTEDGVEVVRSIVSRHITSRGERFRLSSLVLECDVGLGEEGSSQPSIISLQISRDKGHTFGNTLSRSLGTTGEYSKTVEWGRLGMAKSFTFKITFSGSSPLRITGLWANLETQENQLRGDTSQ